MRQLPFLFVAAGCLGCAGRAKPVAPVVSVPASQQVMGIDEPPADPRPGLVAFFEAVRKEDEPAAFASWFNDVDSDRDRRAVEELVHRLVAELIASARFERALAAKFPAEVELQRRSNNLTPDSPRLAAAKYTVYRRLAIVKWGDDEDDGYPMVLDNGDSKASVWKLSMHQWHETTRSSVGDSMLLSGWGARAKDLTTKEVLAGKFTTAQAAAEAFLHHITEIADAADEAGKHPTTAPAGRE